MNERTADVFRWMPFGFLTISLIVAFGFWKIEKSRQRPLPTYAEMMRSQAASQPGQKPPSGMEGKVAPDFSLPTLAGSTLTLADYRGKVVFLNFWATWCAPCEEEMPSMQKLHEHFKDRDFVILSISIDEGKNAVGPFMERLGLTFPVAFDPASEVAGLYGLTGVPETFLIGPTGVIMHHLIGPGDWYNSGIISAFESLLARLDSEKEEATAEATGNRGY